jgi:integrase
MEANSLDTVTMHLGHFTRTVGAHFPIQTLTLAHLQQHVTRRSAQKGFRKRPLSPITIKKEVASFRACWNWGVEAGLLKGRFPNKGLKFPKTTEKPSFQTWEEIERTIARGGLSEVEQKELWDCLYLTLPKVQELLTFAKAHSRYEFLYPMLFTAAHTGARRGELLAARIGDIDFEGGTVLIREKKRVRGQRSFRRVPLSAALEAAGEIDLTAGNSLRWLVEELHENATIHGPAQPKQYRSVVREVARLLLNHEQTILRLHADWPDPARRVWLAALLGDWPTAHAAALLEKDARVLAIVADRAARWMKTNRMEARVKLKGWGRWFRDRTFTTLLERGVSYSQELLRELFDGRGRQWALLNVFRADLPGWEVEAAQFFAESKNEYWQIGAGVYLAARGHQTEAIIEKLTEIKPPWRQIALHQDHDWVTHVTWLAARYHRELATTLIRSAWRSGIEEKYIRTIAVLAMSDASWAVPTLREAIAQVKTPLAVACCRLALRLHEMGVSHESAEAAERQLVLHRKSGDIFALARSGTNDDLPRRWAGRRTAVSECGRSKNG